MMEIVANLSRLPRWVVGKASHRLGWKKETTQANVVWPCPICHQAMYATKDGLTKHINRDHHAT